MLSLFKNKPEKAQNEKFCLYVDKTFYAISGVDGVEFFPKSEGLPKVKSKDVLIILGPELCHIQVCDTPKGDSKEEIEGGLRWQLSAPPFPMEDALVVMEKFGLQNAEKCIAVATSGAVLTELDELCKKSKVNIAGIVPWVAGCLSDLKNKMGAGVADGMLILGEHESRLIVSGESGLAFEKGFPWGGDLIMSNDIDGMARIELDLQRTMDYFDRRVSGTPISRLVIIGNKNVRTHMEQLLEGFPHMSLKKAVSTEGDAFVEASLTEASWGDLFSLIPKKKEIPIGKMVVSGIAILSILATISSLVMMKNTEAKRFQEEADKLGDEIKVWQAKIKGLDAGKEKVKLEMDQLANELKQLEKDEAEFQKNSRIPSDAIVKTFKILNDFKVQEAWFNSLSLDLRSHQAKINGEAKTVMAADEALKAVKAMSLGMTFQKGVLELDQSTGTWKFGLDGEEAKNDK